MSEPTMPDSDGTRSETERAVRNGATLAVALIITWTIGLGVRFVLPRALGPELFGAYNFAETFAAAWFVLLNLGMEMYVQREASLRPEMVTEVGGGLMIVRTALGLLLIVGAVVAVIIDGRGVEVAGLVALFGLGQLVVYYASFLTNGLQAIGKVKRLAITNVVVKVIWGGWLLACVFFHLPLVVFAIAFLLSEMARAASIHATAARELRFEFQVHWNHVFKALRQAAPFFLTACALALSNKLDVSLLGFLVQSDKEVGYYSAANVLASLSLLLAPVMSGVVTPMFNRMRAQSREAFDTLLQQTLLATLHATIPVILLLTLGAELWCRIAFGEAFIPAALSLRAIAPIFGLTYVAMLTSIALIAEGRAWVTTRASVLGIVVSLGVTSLAVPITFRWWPTGGGGVGAAAGSVAMELTTVILFSAALGRRLYSRKLLVDCAKLGLAAAAGTAAFLSFDFPMVTKLALAVIAYLCIIAVTGALTLSHLVGALALIRRRT